MLSVINTAVCKATEGCNICVETDIRSGLPNINIVGLASTTVMESRERIKSAIINSGFEYPRGKITVNLTPSDLRKNGSNLDLPIAVGLLASNMFVDASKVKDYGIIGALSLDGKVHSVDGVLPMLIAMKKNNIRKVIIPYENMNEASLISSVEVFGIRYLKECAEIINNNMVCRRNDSERMEFVSKLDKLDFSDIKGQENAKRAVSIAVTGRHGLILVGSPGCGKSMLAKRIPTIMPQMNEDEIIETAIIYSIAGNLGNEKNILIDRPFRSPHSSIGKAGLLGGGNIPVPGEITLAHNGVLFLDEICEFNRDVIETLRIPIEEKKITHFRNGYSYTFPCNFQIVMASNPCKCGYYGDSEVLCKCSQSQIENYRRKLSGPMMDRIDIRVQMERVGFNEIQDNELSTSSEILKSDILRGINFAREHGRIKPNALMDRNDMKSCCILGENETLLLKSAYYSMNLSPRSYDKVLKVSRTIADMDESERIKEKHIAEALSYRVISRMEE